MGAELVTGWLVRRRTLLLTVAPVVALLFARPRPLPFAVGLGLVVAGQVLRLWAAGVIVKERELTTIGPYAWVRNPLYLGSLLITGGWAAMCARPVPGGALLFLFFLTHWPTIASEERVLRERFGAEFDDYCRRVPRLIPRLPAARGAPGAWSWRRATDSYAAGGNSEGVSALAVAVLCLAYASRLWWLPW